MMFPCIFCIKSFNSVILLFTIYSVVGQGAGKVTTPSVTTHGTQKHTDPCLGYAVINNWQRSTGYVTSPKSPKICDVISFRPGWYRFVSKAGGEIPTKCPNLYTCGTDYPIWLKGTNPTRVNEIKSLPACVHVPGAGCCGSRFQWNVKVKKCSPGADIYFVYYLRRAATCQSAYCAGSNIPCSKGSNSPTGFTPGCTNEFPPITSKPRLFPGVKDKRIAFTCAFESSERGKTSVFEITWYQGVPGKKIITQIAQTNLVKGALRTAILRNKNSFPNRPLFYLGTTISCRVRSWFSYSINKTSPFEESNHYYAGIKVYPSQITFRLSEKDKPLKLHITATVPIVCETTIACSVLVEFGQDILENLLDVCTIQFKPGPANQTKTLEIVAKRDFLNDGDHTMHLKTFVLEHVDPVDWNNHRKIEDTQIIAVDVGTERCTSSGDPHLYTFDKLSYNHYAVGDYVLVNSTCRRFEVHVRTWKCSSVSCNCGIAAREGDDVVVVDMCRDKIPRARYASTVEPSDGTSIQRDKNGKSFLINFPSGAFIRFDAHRWYGNIYYANFIVQVPSDDYQCTRGLCGTFDKNKNNELISKDGHLYPKLQSGRIAPKGFSESWKLPPGHSMFYYKGGPRKCLVKRAKHYCTCKEFCCGRQPNRQINCDYKGYAQRPKYVQGMKGWKKLNFPGAEHCGKRKRRSTSSNIILPDDEADIGIYAYNPDPNLDVKPPVWPTATGKTEAGTKVHCEEAIRDSEPGKVCKAYILDFDFVPFVEQCLEDVQVTDNYNFTESAISTMQDACEEIALKNITLWKKNPSKNNTLEPPSEIGNTLCPNLCSGNGQCINATCICKLGYDSADCSIETTKGPTVETMPLNGLCDARKRDCTRFRVVGSDFLDSENLTCRLTEVKISGKPHVVTSTIHRNQGFLLSYKETMCEMNDNQLPIKLIGNPSSTRGIPAGGFLVHISNDGIKYSQTQGLYIVYDSKCMKCQGDVKGICTHKKNTCKVNDYCFAANDTNPSDPCSICHPSTSTTSFTKFKDVRAHINATCRNVNGKCQCSCRLGYTGNGALCTDVDECSSGLNNCHAEADCKNTKGSFHCVCNPGLSGDGLQCNKDKNVEKQTEGNAARDTATAAIVSSVVAVFVIVIVVGRLWWKKKHQLNTNKGARFTTSESTAEIYAPAVKDAKVFMNNAYE